MRQRLVLAFAVVILAFGIGVGLGTVAVGNDAHPIAHAPSLLTKAATKRPAATKPQSVTRQSRPPIVTVAKARPDRAQARSTTKRLDPITSVSGTVLVQGLAKPGLWARPVRGYLIQPYRGTAHEGLDLAGNFGDPIFSVGDGVVVGAGPMGGYGNYVAILHPGGDASLYAHIQSWSVKVGQRVLAGQQIAEVGAEGAASGPHLHFEIHKGGLNWNYIDPEKWLAERGITLR